MSWAEVSVVNGDFLNAPLDVKMHLADYKMHGEKSYVFQIKDLLYGVYECTYLSMNDLDINGEALEYLIKNNKHIGKALASIYGIKNTQTLLSLPTIQAVVNDSTAMAAIAENLTAMTAVAASSAAVTAIVASYTAVAAICKVKYNTIRDFIKIVNDNDSYIKKIFDTVTKDSKAQLIVSKNENIVSNLDQYCNTPDTIIFCALGKKSNGGGSTNIHINKEFIKFSNSAGDDPQRVTKDNLNAIAVPKAPFTAPGGYVAIVVYKI